MNLSIITPTCGRNLLRRLVEATTKQMVGGDEHLIVADLSFGVEVAWVGPEFADIPGVHVAAAINPRSAWGNAQRDLAIALAVGDFLTFMDDDDCYVPGALDAIREAVAIDPEAAHLFNVDGIPPPPKNRSEMGPGGGGTPCIVVPNRKEVLPKWNAHSHRESDMAWMMDAVDAFGGRMLKHEITIAEVGPRPGGKVLDGSGKLI